jgi:hypothetical protein
MNIYSTKIFIRKNSDNEDNAKIVELNTKLPGEEYTIGWVDGCDIQLSNDTGYISKLHCILKKEVVGWVIYDTSTNGTTVIKEGHKTELQNSQKFHISDQDVIIIENWYLTFSEPTKTKKKHPILLKCLCPWVFNVSEETLYKIENGNRTRVKISPQIRKILHYMASQNIAHNNRPQVCRYKDLIKIIWEEDTIPYPLGMERLRVVTQKIRKILELSENGHKGEKWLESSTNEGYILKIDCEL